MRKIIRVSSSDHSGKEQEYLSDCISRNHLSQGYYVQKFEERFADLCGAKHAIACSSGTAALHLALLSLGIDNTDIVTVPALTYVATANAARYCGASVQFQDVNPESWCCDSLPSPAISCSVSVHLYDSYSPARSLIADCSHLAPSPRVLENSGIATFSFYGSKIISCGEGGMIVIKDGSLAETISHRVKLYRGQGATKPGVYWHEVIGYNYRMTDMQAAVGLAQLERLPEFLSRRREIIDRYEKSFCSYASLQMQGGEEGDGWMFAILLPCPAAEIAKIFLSKYSIETRPFFHPLNLLGPYTSTTRLLDDDTKAFTVAESIYSRGLCLPTHTLLRNDEVDYVCESLISEVKLWT